MRATAQDHKWITGCMIIIAGIACQCARDVVQEQGEILATIDDKTITVKDFQVRTELTVRPQYPALKNDEINRLYLNNLIAEKLMALDGQKEKLLIDNPLFQAKMKGIQEQNMREQLYNLKISSCAPPNTNELKQAYALAGREYNISFYTVQNDSFAGKIKNEFKKTPDLFESIYYQFSSEKRIPKKVVKFNDPDPVVVNSSLFSKPLKVGQVIGPIKIESNQYIVIRVDNWKYYPAISTSEIQNRWINVNKKLKERKSFYAWKSYMTNLMAGKKINFEKDTFIKLSKIFFSMYDATDKSVRRETYGDFMTDDTRQIHFNNEMFEDILLDHPFLTIDNEEWTVRDFRDAFSLRPLVFEYRAVNLKDFQQQFREAIILMVSDHFLTKEAYKQKLDKDPYVQHMRTMWEDAYVAMYHRDQIIKKIRERNNIDPKLIKEKSNYLSMYIDSLQQKYGSKISVNETALDSIKLTDINMYAMQPGMPYPVAVPGFPILVQDGQFEYIRIKQNN